MTKKDFVNEEQFKLLEKRVSDIELTLVQIDNKLTAINKYYAEILSNKTKKAL